MRRQMAKQFFLVIFSFAGFRFFQHKLTVKRATRTHACIINVLLLTTRQVKNLGRGSNSFFHFVQLPGRPAKEKIIRKNCFAIWCLLFSNDAHPLGKDVAYNAMERLWPQASAIHPSTFINFIKAKGCEGSSVASLPEIGLLEHEHCGAGT